MEPTSTSNSFPYSVKKESPLVDTVLNTSPIIPRGAKEETKKMFDDISNGLSKVVTWIVRVTGNAKDAITATSAARNVLNIYRIITVLMTPPWLFPEWHKELIIRKNTRSGATAFNAPTNIPIIWKHAKRWD